MSRPRSFGRGRAWAAALLLAAGCRSAPAATWNLEQLHATDGTHKRRAQVMGEIEFVLNRLFRATNFGGAEFKARQQSEERIDDPPGECLENALDLADCERDEKVACLQAATFAWLAVDCPYVLTRERCALELGRLATALGVPDVPAPPSGEPAGPDAVKAIYDELLAVVQGVVASPGLPGGSQQDVCARIAAMVLEREGALRLLRAANTLLEGGDRGGALAPLRALRLDLARRCTALALRAAAGDLHGRVRAAVLQSSVRAFPDERAALLRAAVLSTLEPTEVIEARTELSLRALQLVAKNGLPPPPPGADAAAFEREWIDLLVQVLRVGIDGPHNSAACRALARITGKSFTLRPEVWLARWRAQRAAEEPTRSTAGASP